MLTPGLPGSVQAIDDIQICTRLYLDEFQCLQRSPFVCQNPIRECQATRCKLGAGHAMQCCTVCRLKCGCPPPCSPLPPGPHRVQDVRCGGQVHILHLPRNFCAQPQDQHMRAEGGRPPAGGALMWSGI